MVTICLPHSAGIQCRRARERVSGLGWGGKKPQWWVFLADLPHFYLVNLPSGSLSVWVFSQSVVSLLCLIVVFCNLWSVDSVATLWYMHPLWKGMHISLYIYIISYGYILVMGTTCGTFETDATNMEEKQASIGQWWPCMTGRCKKDCV